MSRIPFNFAAVMQLCQWNMHCTLWCRDKHMDSHRHTWTDTDTGTERGFLMIREWSLKIVNKYCWLIDPLSQGSFKATLALESWIRLDLLSHQRCDWKLFLFVLVEKNAITSVRWREWTQPLIYVQCCCNWNMNTSEGQNVREKAPPWCSSCQDWQIPTVPTVMEAKLDGLTTNNLEGSDLWVNNSLLN